MRAHSVRGSPVKFRVVLGAAALGWEETAKNSNFVHAGIRDRSIYIGSFLLAYIFKEGNEALRKEILDKDDYLHLIGLGHGTPEEYEKRTKLVREVISSEGLEEIHTAIEEKDVYFLLEKLRSRLAEGPGEVLEFLSAVNNVAMSQPLYPVERTYPIKHAVALLNKEEQRQLTEILTSSREIVGYREQNVIYEILLMLGESRTLKDWIDVHAPNLRGRTLWQISPEIWHEAGGLARVMQYHGAGILELVKDTNVRFRQIEPHYQNRIDAEGKPHPLDYTNKQQLTHPVEGTIEEVARYFVTVGGKKVEVAASKGVNDLGIEVFLIKDVQPNGKSYYTHSLYNYSNPWEKNPELPTWEEFSVFYSKASLELVRIIEEREKNEIGSRWKAPVIHLNDSQVALVSVYRKIFHENDPVLGGATVAFTTHTYGNRKAYPVANGYGDGVLDFMEIPGEYREFFKRDYGKLFDIASAGLRTADWQGAVARAHRDDVAMFDEWVDFPQDPGLEEYYRKRGANVELIAVANGDHRSNTAVYFDEKLKKLYGNDVDLERPEPDQVAAAKKQAKLDLAIGPERVYYSSHIQQDWERSLLSPEQMVVSYSGRLVPEKAGRKRAFVDQNIKALLKAGVQVIIYGNVQVNNSSSQALAQDIKNLINELRGDPQYTGRLIFVPRFTLNEQRMLLAATDVQVQDSDPSTEAAGFTEADVSRTGGIEVGTKRTDNKVGEGLFQAQGVPMDLGVPGKGNVLTPERLDAESYLKTIMTLLDKYNKDELKYYQATSVRLSRVLEARLTSAAYLKEFSKAVEIKDNRSKAKEMREEMERNERERKTLLAQVHRADSKNSPADYLAYRIRELIISGEADEAVTLFFTDESFQDELGSIQAPATVFNQVIDTYVDNENTGKTVKKFLLNVSRLMLELSSGSDKGEVSKAVQLMANQALTIISWIDNGVPGARGIRLTSNVKNSVENSRGTSYIDRKTLPEGIKEVKDEGGPGFYWRGTEAIGKLGDNLLEYLVFDDQRFKDGREKTVMYLMDHGFLGVPASLTDDTGNKRVSTIHETVFMSDLLPGSLQTTSTGAGHFQADKVDIKHVTGGRGLQVNVKYGMDGRIEEVLVYEMEEGSWCLALPGYVDYVINLGGLRFNDVSLSVSPEEAKRLNPDYDENIVKSLEAVVKEKGKKAPYAGMMTKRGPVIVKAVQTAPEAILARPGRVRDVQSLVGLYARTASREQLFKVAESLVPERALPHGSASSSRISVISSEKAAIKAVEDSRGANKAPALGKTESMRVFIDDNRTFVNGVIGENSRRDKLLRIPIEVVELVGADNIRGFVEAFQRTRHGYVEIYSLEKPEGVSDVHGLIIKDLPDSLREEKRDRTNTVTIFPVFKGEEISANRNKRWGTVDPLKGIVSPVGYNYDKAGIVRSAFIGLRLSEVAANENYGTNSNFVVFTLAEYMDLCLALGVSSGDFDITAQDLVNIARGDMKILTASLNKLIKLLPIIPYNAEELRIIYERAKKSIDVKA
ncbi:MAG: glycogen/starch synthase [Candidatus Omnitrophica bacterium]|nr:glycogen/starch synthase [Candidatus Omnitrophota bacterium]